MQIRRDYSQPFFGKKPRRRRSWGRWAFAVGLVIGGLLLYAVNNMESLQATAIDLMGLAPTETPVPGALANTAMLAYRAGHTQEALDLFERAIAERPDDVDYLYEYGFILIELGDSERALELADHAIEVDTFDPRGYALKARALVWLDNAATAIPVGLSGLQVDSEYPPLYAVLARAYVDTGNYPTGLEYGEKGVELDPNSAETRRSYAYALSSVGAYEEAVFELETALLLNPDNIQIHFELAFQYTAADRDLDAIGLYERVLTMQPQNARALLRMCDVNRKIGRFEVAEQYCEDAANADITYAPAQFRLGIIKYSNRDFVIAQIAFQRCVDAEPDNLECLYRLGLTHYYLALETRQKEQSANVPAVPPTPVQEATARNEMLEMAMTAVESEDLPTEMATLAPTFTPTATPEGLTSTQHCDLAWDILQDALPQAQLVANDIIISDVRLGLSLVAQDCPKYRGAAPTLDFTPTPTLTPEPIDPILTEEMMSEG